jgi:hypothetical protein
MSDKAKAESVGRDGMENVAQLAMTQAVSTFMRSEFAVSRIMDAVAGAICRSIDKCETAEDFRNLRKQLTDKNFQDGVSSVEK